MTKDLFDKYIWLVDTIYRARKITFEEINERWLRSRLSEGEDIPLRTFHAVDEQSLKKIPADVSLIADKLSIDKFHKGFVFKGFTVIHITRSNHKIQELSAFVAYEM